LLLQVIYFILFSVRIYIGLNEDKDEAIKHMKYARNSFSVKFATRPDKPTKDELWDHRDTVKGELGYEILGAVRVRGAAAGLPPGVRDHQGKFVSVLSFVHYFIHYDRSNIVICYCRRLNSFFLVFQYILA
jgi:hypothetical protein